MPHRAGRRGLKPAQQLVLAALSREEADELTRGRYEQLAGVSRSQAAYDLAELVERGIFERIGGGRSTRYRLVRPSQPSQRRWTNERIREGLSEFCDGRETWPSAAEFKSAGRTDLYVAASRYGGIGFWTTELGFSRPARASSPERSRRFRRPKLRLATAGLVFAIALVGVAAAAFYTWRDTAAREAGARPARQASSTAKVHRKGAVTAKVHGKANTAKAKRDRTRQQSAHRSSPSSRVNRSAELAAQTVTSHFAPATSRQASAASARAPLSSSGPAPLASPPSGGTGTPTPLPSP
jgi:hypothetical protein